MSEPTPDRVEALFHDALLRPRDEREGFIAEASGGDAGLADEALSLLRHHDAVAGFLSIPAVEDPRDPGARSAGGSPGATAGGPMPRDRRIGSYRILDVLGAGGMGVVYRAEQENPRRVVALKVLRAGLATPAMLRRFEHEAELLGRLHHPGIAQIYEAGTADTGAGAQPYFAMELVDGQPLLEHAHASGLGTRQRLDLLARVCDAVHSAHQNGVIHRDLKPGNLLVDRSGQPKILDFGVARATDSDLQTTTLHTDIGQLIGTIPYMSPEQAAGDPAQIDVRSDVYALGVVAYELMAGRLPYDLRDKMVHEAVRVIRETDPTPLSALSRTFRGDVETIVGKALEKERARRYQSASELAADIRRFLHDEPIAARPASAVYQARKFVRRHRGLVAAVALVFLVLVAGLVGTFREWQRAEEALRQQARLTGEARNEAETAAAVADFLTDDLIAAAQPQVSRGREITVREVVDDAEGRVSSRFGEKPLVEAAVRSALGSAYFNLGQYERARLQQERALELWLEHVGDRDERAMVSMHDLGVSLTTLNEFDAGQAMLERALKLRRQHLGGERIETVQTLTMLAVNLLERGRYEEAEPMINEAVEASRRIVGDDHADALPPLVNLGTMFMATGRYAEAEPILRRVHELDLQFHGADHPDTIEAGTNIAMMLLRLARHADAETALRAQLEVAERVFGPEHPETLELTNMLGVLYRDLARYDEAEVMVRRTLEGRRRALGEEHADTLIAQLNLGYLYLGMKRLDEAEPILVAAVAAMERVLGPEHPNSLAGRTNLAVLYGTQGRYDLAEPLYRDILDATRRALGDEHQQTLVAMSNVAFAAGKLGRPEEAEETYRRALEISRRTLGPNHTRTLSLCGNLGALLNRLERPLEAGEFIRAAADGYESQLGEAHPKAISARRSLANVLIAVGRYTDAEPIFDRMVEVVRGRAPLDEQELADCLLGQGKCRRARGALALGNESLVEALALVEPHREARAAQYEAIRRELAELGEQAGRADADPGGGE